MKDIMLVYNNINNVFDIVKRAADRISAKVVNEDINTFKIELEIKGGVFSKSELITINLEKIKDLQTKIYFDDHSKQGSIATKNDNVEKLKLIINELTPKMKLPDNEIETQEPTQEPMMNNMNQEGYNDQYSQGYNNQVMNDGMMMNNYQQMDNGQYMMNDGYQNMPVDNQYTDQYPAQNQDYQQVQDFQNYQNQDYQQVQDFQNYQNQGYQQTIPEQQSMEQPMDQQESDPVNELMMGNYDKQEQTPVSNAPAQSSEKVNSDPLRDFMSNMNI